MTERLFIDTEPQSIEEVFQPGRLSSSYEDFAGTQWDVYHQTEQMLATAENDSDISDHVLVEFLADATQRERDRYVKLHASESEVDRFERLMFTNPHQVQNLMEMALEIGLKDTEAVIFTTKLDGGHTKEIRMRSDAEVRADVEQYVARYKLNDQDKITLDELVLLAPKELEARWQDFSEVAHKKRAVMTKRDGLVKKFEDEAKTAAEKAAEDAATADLEAARANLEDRAITPANIIRFKAKDAVLTLDPKGFDRGDYPDIATPYDGTNERAKWATDKIVQVMIDHPNRRTRVHKEAMAKVEQELLQQKTGEAVFGYSRNHPNKLPKAAHIAAKIRQFITEKGEVKREPTELEIQQIGLAVLEHAEKVRNARDEKQRLASERKEKFKRNVTEVKALGKAAWKSARDYIMEETTDKAA